MIFLTETVLAVLIFLGFTEAIGGVHVVVQPHANFVETVLNAEAIAAAKKASREKAALSAAEPKQMKLYTMEEVEQHTKMDDCWFVIDGKVYDVTPWMHTHPGGGPVMLKQAGKDASRIFKVISHSSFALKEAEKYVIGELAPSAKL